MEEEGSATQVKAENGKPAVSAEGERALAVPAVSVEGERALAVPAVSVEGERVLVVPGMAY